jgi:hypothetical protein
MMISLFSVFFFFCSCMSFWGRLCIAVVLLKVMGERKHSWCVSFSAICAYTHRWIFFLAFFEGFVEIELRRLLACLQYIVLLQITFVLIWLDLVIRYDRGYNISGLVLPGLRG